MSEKTFVHAGPWSGAVNDQGAVIKASVSNEVQDARLLVSTDPLFSQARFFPSTSIWQDPETDYENKIVIFSPFGLEPNRQFYYQLVLNDTNEECVGAFKTFPPVGSRQDFKIAFASCSGNNKIINFSYPMPESFISVRKEPNLLFFLHLGDFHYANIRKREIPIRLRKYDWMLRRKEPGDLFRAHALAYIWDDHDFLGDDTDGGDPKYQPASLFARDAYDLYVPHYPFAGDGSDGIYQSFVVGNVLFVLTDSRFNKLRHGSDTSPRSMLGVKQKEWLQAQLLKGKNYDLVVWGNSLPWIGKENPRQLFWSGYWDERTSICEFILANEITNLCMLSGDAHMLAIDDGSNSGFAKNGGGGFPIFHAAALESRPNRKGGVYSKGKEDGSPGRGIAGTGQYGVMEIKYPRDPNGSITGAPRVYWTGKRVRRKSSNAEDIETRVLLTHEFAAETASAPKKPSSK